MFCICFFMRRWRENGKDSIFYVFLNLFWSKIWLVILREFVVWLFVYNDSGFDSLLVYLFCLDGISKCLKIFDYRLGSGLKIKWWCVIKLVKKDILLMGF